MEPAEELKPQERPPNPYSGDWKTLQQYLQEGDVRQDGVVSHAIAASASTNATVLWVRALKLDFCATWISEPLCPVELYESEEVLRAWEARRASREVSKMREESLDESARSSLDLNEMLTSSTHGDDTAVVRNVSERMAELDRKSNSACADELLVRRAWI